MVTPQHALPAGRGPAALELLELDSLPCGCVAAAYRARLWDLGVICIEARGPHCLNETHVQGRLIEMGALADLSTGDQGD